MPTYFQEGVRQKPEKSQECIRSVVFLRPGSSPFVMNCSINLIQAVYKTHYSFTTAGLKDLYICKFDVKCPLSANCL